jgi:hypothetical protein
MCAKIDEPGVMDSGANVSVTNPLTVHKFNLSPQRWERPFHIIFGNGARFHCTHYAHFGPILGKVAIVDGAPDTLLSIAVLTARGFKVRFLPSGQGVGIYKDQKLLFHGPQHEESRLFHIDIQSLIHPPTEIGLTASTPTAPPPAPNQTHNPALRRKDAHTMWPIVLISTSTRLATFYGFTREWDTHPDLLCTSRSCTERGQDSLTVSSQPK